MQADAGLSTGPFNRPSTPRCVAAYAGAAGLIHDSVRGGPAGSLPHISPTGTILRQGDVPGTDRSKAYVAKYQPVTPARASFTAMSIWSRRTLTEGPPPLGRMSTASEPSSRSCGKSVGRAALYNSLNTIPPA